MFIVAKPDDSTECSNFPESTVSNHFYIKYGIIFFRYNTAIIYLFCIYVYLVTFSVT